MTSTTDRALPSSAVQLRCWSRPTTTTRLPLLSDSATCSAWSRHTTTVKNDASCSRRRIAYRKLGRYVRFHPDDLAEYVAAHRVEAGDYPEVG
jgi:hypothetical protein